MLEEMDLRGRGTNLRFFFRFLRTRRQCLQVSATPERLHSQEWGRGICKNLPFSAKVSTFEKGGQHKEPLRHPRFSMRLNEKNLKL